MLRYFETKMTLDQEMDAKKMFVIVGTKESFFGGLELQTLPLFQTPMVVIKDGNNNQIA